MTGPALPILLRIPLRPLWPLSACPAPGLLLRRLAAEHLQHPLGHHVPADHVGRGEHRGHEGDDVADRVVRGQPDQQRADQHDAVDRVGRRHQRRVQGGRDLPDDLDADQQREDEDGQVSEQGRRHRRLPRVLGPAGCWPRLVLALLVEALLVASGRRAGRPRPRARPGRRA